MLEIARDSKGRLKTKVETVSIKIRLEKNIAGQVRDMAEQLDVPMASIIRFGIELALEKVSQ